jgi:hypothetical protein
MSKKRTLPKPSSLVQLVEAPDNCHGFFGWLCGYSADAAFLNDALERFTRKTASQRAYEGKIYLAAMIDPSNAWMSPVDVPGIAHLRMVDISKRPFRLLHAKVALLGFRADNDADDWRIRLIVSTGNWTCSTMQESLDLAWYIEIDRQALRDDTDEVKAARTDISAAWNMLRWLRGFFATEILTATPEDRRDTASGVAFERFEAIVSQVRRAQGVEPRFFDNRHGSLLDQVPAKVRILAGDVKRNYIGMGSGFYENSTEKKMIPSVLSKVVDTLKDENLLTQDPEVDVFVNPRGCQAVAKSLLGLADNGWTVRKAYKHEGIFGEGTDRSLHAKFILSGNARDRSNACTSPWLYIGSGNLTGPGFTLVMSQNGGNLEAGVVVRTDRLFWCNGRAVPPERVIPNILPIRWDECDVLTSASGVSAGPDFVMDEPNCLAPPVGYLIWKGGEDVGLLTLPSSSAVEGLEVLDLEGNGCARDLGGAFFWPDNRPRQVQIRWNAEGTEACTALIPVLDEFGRVAAASLRAIEVDEALYQLESFPMMPDESDEEGDEGADIIMGGMELNDTAKFTGTDAYPIRTMMHLIERIAAQQTSTGRADWTAWCIRFEQTLIQAAQCSALQEFKPLGLNPLSPLRHAPFRPVFAENSESPEGRRYEEALARVEAVWDVGGLDAIGADEP